MRSTGVDTSCTESTSLAGLLCLRHPTVGEQPGLLGARSVIGCGAVVGQNEAIFAADRDTKFVRRIGRVGVGVIVPMSRIALLRSSVRIMVHRVIDRHVVGTAAAERI